MLKQGQGPHEDGGAGRVGADGTRVLQVTTLSDRIVLIHFTKAADSLWRVKLSFSVFTEAGFVESPWVCSGFTCPARESSS